MLPSLTSSNLPTPSIANMFDVAVIGAGLSGLQAAYSAQQAGLSVVVIEARDRVGGKTWSVPLASGRGVADLGAAWINVNTQKRIAAYTKKFNLSTVEQRIVGRAVMQVSKGERIEFPFGITPDVSWLLFWSKMKGNWTNEPALYSSHQQRRRTSK